MNQVGAKLVAEIHRMPSWSFRRACKQEAKLYQILVLERKLHGTEKKSANKDGRIEQLRR